MASAPDSIPLFWSEEGRTAEVVRCHFGHLGFRETFERVGGCPYCTYTPGERQAAPRALGTRSSARRGVEKDV